MIFAKVAANLDTHPKIRKAGRDGREVFLFVLRKNAELDLGGVVPSLHVESWYLADQLMMSESEASHGLSRCVTAGLLVQDGHAFLIAGWDDEWSKRPLTGAERQARHRAKTITSDSSITKVTDSNGAIRDESLCNGSDQIRVDEIRSEESRGRSRASARPAPVPPGWLPDAMGQKLATELGLSCDDELAKFRDHYASKPARIADWDATFRNWLRKAGNFAPKRSQGNAIAPELLALARSET